MEVAIKENGGQPKWISLSEFKKILRKTKSNSPCPPKLKKVDGFERWWKLYDYVKNKIGKTKVETPADIRKAVEGIVEYENKNIEDGKLVDFYLSKEYGFMDEAEKLSKINLPSGLSYTDIKSGNYSKGGRVASNPNPYEPRAI